MDWIFHVSSFFNNYHPLWKYFHPRLSLYCIRNKPVAQGAATTQVGTCLILAATMTCYQGMSYPLPWARKVQRVENWQMPVVWMPSQLQRSSFLKGFTWHLHSVQIPHLAVFGDLKSHQTLPWFIFLQVIRAHRQAPLARLHLGISWPSRLYGWRQTWTSACTGQLDLKLIATFLSFHIISYLVFILPKRQCRKSLFFIQLKMCFHFEITYGMGGIVTTGCPGWNSKALAGLHYLAEAATHWSSLYRPFGPQRWHRGGWMDWFCNLMAWNQQVI